MLKDYSNLMLFLTAFQSGLFALFLLTLRSRKKRDNRILGIYLLTLFFQLAHSLVARFGLLETIPHLAYQGSKFIFLGGPLLYLYARSIAKNLSIRKWDWLHFLPAIAMSSYIFFSYDILSVADKLAFLQSRQALVVPWVSAMLLYFYYLQLISYIIASIRLVHLNSVENISWLKFLLYGFAIIWTFDILMLGMKAFTPELADVYYPWLEAISRTYTFSYINVFVFKGLLQPALFHGENREPTGPKYEKSALSEPRKQQMLDELQSYMQNRKPHLNPELTLAQLAEALNIQPKYLSQVINEKLGKNFFDFVNCYRIEEAKAKLVNPPDEKITVLEVLYDVGFNSKSSFNAAFKKGAENPFEKDSEWHSRPYVYENKFFTGFSHVNLSGVG
ncbi:MAG: helix-turn-helix domain-containing protein, partial [Calditrichota bacterium]